MQNPTENDRKPDNRAGCAVADGSRPFWPCPHRCETWVRCEPIDLTYNGPNHHSKCEHRDATLIDVWRVSLGGSSYVTNDEADADEAVALYSEDPDSVPTVTKEKMHAEVYDNLPEFDGF